MQRVGVFVCHCGHNIGSVVDVEKVVEYAKQLENVAVADHNLYSCSEEGLGSIKKSIRENKLDVVVVAACTPRTHEPLFRRACEQAGVNKYLFEFVNIREHCSWIHAKEKEAATEKAKRLIAMGVAKASLLTPQKEGEASVIPVAAVIGGGIAGLTAAASLVSQGIETHVIEKEARLGGLLNNISVIGPEFVETEPLIRRLKEDLERSPQAHIHLESRIVELGGFIGNFDIKIAEGAKTTDFKVGAIIVATGGRELEPTNVYGFGKIPTVITQMELEKRLAGGAAPSSAIFIQCVECRQPGREYCSRICCNVTLKNALRIIRSNPNARVTVLHRDIMSYGTTAERLYREASESGVSFMRYGLESPPKISEKEDGASVEVFDETLNENIGISGEIVVLATPIISQEGTAETAKLLKVPADKNGFFLEAHVKLRPVEFATDGVFICGSARWPSHVTECIAQGLAAAAKAAIPIRGGKVVIEAITAEVDVERCAACGNCVLACPYEAIEMTVIDGKRCAKVNEAQCKGCGTCVAACPNDAMQQKGFTTRQLGAMIDALIKNCKEEAVE
ncbi:MAG TPA: CoB--CoM heterodisulfide reductase iron-sulfur subunit A family protein [Euryarchaeota archaeon]|nr:CoB--CoM heterodisulfide reductase iron-sulfur subunit A family protein [Euryarchaeota archaeon]